VGLAPAETALLPFAWDAGIDLYACDPDRLLDRETIVAFMPALVSAIGMETHGSLQIQWFGKGALEGWTAVQLITTSNIDLHTVGQDCLVLTIVSCSEYDPADAASVAVQFFGGQAIIHPPRLRGRRPAD
jgi:S-adenosylmethionine/arginine decarboxylase-like enzyme